jgi:hypothetical protein
MDQETITTEAPGIDSGAEEKSAGIPTTVEELANSFIERVEESPEADSPKAEAIETADADEGSEEDVLLQSSQSEEESEVEVEETEAEPPKGVGKLLKQVGKLTARAKGSEEKVEALQAKIAALESQPNDQKAEPQGSPVLEEVANFDDLEKVRKEAVAAKKWAVQHLGKDYVEEGEKEYSGDEIREIFAAADEYLTEKIPQRAGFLKAKAESDARSREVFDFWDNPEDEANLLYQQVLADPRYASLNALPNRDFVMGLIVEGFRSVNAKAESKGKPAAKKRTAKTPPATLEESVAPPPQPKTDRQNQRIKSAIAAGNISANQFADLLT